MTAPLTPALVHWMYSEEFHAVINVPFFPSVNDTVMCKLFYSLRFPACILLRFVSLCYCQDMY